MPNVLIRTISAINPELVKGVITYGRNKQQVYGAQPGLPTRHVVYESTFTTAKSDKSCGSYHTVHKGGAELDSLVDDVTLYAGVPVVRFAGGLNPSLLKLDERYGELQTASVGLEVAKVLSGAAPFDLNEAELPHYKGLVEKWQKWEATRSISNRYGVLLGEALINRQK